MKGIVLHHTVTNEDSNGARAVKAIQNDHRNNNGWFDIAYNFLIDKLGNVYEGRGENVRQGATAANAKKFGSTQYANKLYYAVAFLGNYEVDTLSPQAMDAFKELRFDLMTRGLGEEIEVHRKFKVSDKCVPGTACPGKNVLSAVELLKRPVLVADPVIEQNDWQRIIDIASKYV